MEKCAAVSRAGESFHPWIICQHMPRRPGGHGDWSSCVSRIHALTPWLHAIGLYKKVSLSGRTEGGGGGRVKLFQAITRELRRLCMVFAAAAACAKGRGMADG